MLHYEFMRIAFLIGILLGIALPLVGSTAVFKRLSSSGDALAHSSLAGVAIGLAASAGKSLAVINPEVGGMITAIILTSTIVYELVGPALTKMALSKAGEIPARG